MNIEMLGNNQYLNEGQQFTLGFVSLILAGLGFIVFCELIIKIVCKRFLRRNITIYVPDEGMSTSVKVRPDFFELQIPKNRRQVSPSKFIDSPV